MHVYPCKKFLNAVDTNLFQLRSTNPKKNYQTLDVFFGGGLGHPPKKKVLILFLFIISNFYSSKVFKFTWNMRNRLNRKKNKISDFSFCRKTLKQADLEWMPLSANLFRLVSTNPEKNSQTQDVFFLFNAEPIFFFCTLYIPPQKWSNFHMEDAHIVKWN